MPKRKDIRKILLIGSGPIVIGQACEFDYSGTQALKALREEGYEVILVNSNPATIMTDPELSDKVYVEPLTPEFLERVIAAENARTRFFPTMGGQTALNLTMPLHQVRRVSKKHGVELLGATPEAIHKAEDRETFKATMNAIGVDCARSAVARSLDDARKIIARARPSADPAPVLHPGRRRRRHRLYRRRISGKSRARALPLARPRTCWSKKASSAGRNSSSKSSATSKDNVIIVCSIENFDPMGVHTGDCITVAPAQTLTDREYQNLRDQSIRIIRAIGVETGGSNIQFAVNPANGRIIVIEMNPRVSRSSRAGLQGHGLPDRARGGQACRRLHARRAHQRHHRHHALLVRAFDRLRRDQDPAL